MFKLNYTKDLSELFISQTLNFIKNDPAGNLIGLIKAINLTL